MSTTTTPFAQPTATPRPAYRAAALPGQLELVFNWEKTAAALPVPLARLASFLQQRAALLLLAGTLLAAPATAGTPAAGTDPVVAARTTPTDGKGENPLEGTVLRGRILDQNGQPLVGATVLLKGSYFGASTNAEGYYTFQLPASKGTPELLFGYAGYHDVQVPLASAAPETVTLTPRPDWAPKKRPWWFIFS